MASLQLKNIEEDVVEMDNSVDEFWNQGGYSMQESINARAMQ